MSAAAADDTALVSVVAPVYNEIETLPEFHRRVTAALAGRRYELVLVDDGSNDGSGELLEQLAARDTAVRPVHLSRNFGHQAALTAGLEAARGAAVVTMDADLQDPPEAIPRLLEQWSAGADVVHGVRHERRGESRRRLFVIRQFYRVFNRLSGLASFPGHSGDFRLISRRALDALNALPERNRFVRGLVSWVGFRQVSVVYERDARYAGVTKYTLRRMLRFSLDAVASLSNVPLQIATVLGFVCAFVAFLAIPVVVALKIFGSYLPGFSTITIVVLLLGGLNLIAVGIIGEYVGRIYDEVKRRPLYVVRERRNMREDESVDDAERERISTW
jgi:dolichol-phosphate mannosyltransferase